VSRIENAPEIVQGLNGYYFTWKNSTDSGLQVGVIAQEVEAVLPELVRTGSDGVKSVDYPKLTAVLIEDNKSLSHKVKNLEAQSRDLQRRLSLLEQRFKAASNR
jgi:Chaperone of endosialidase